VSAGNRARAQVAAREEEEARVRSRHVARHLEAALLDVGFALEALEARRELKDSQLSRTLRRARTELVGAQRIVDLWTDAPQRELLEELGNPSQGPDAGPWESSDV